MVGRASPCRPASAAWLIQTPGPPVSSGGRFPLAAWESGSHLTRGTAAGLRRLGSACHRLISFLSVKKRRPPPNGRSLHTRHGYFMWLSGGIPHSTLHLGSLRVGAGNPLPARPIRALPRCHPQPPSWAALALVRARALSRCECLSRLVAIGAKHPAAMAGRVCVLVHRFRFASVDGSFSGPSDHRKRNHDTTLEAAMRLYAYVLLRYRATTYA